MFKSLAVIAVCGAITVALGYLNIWLGILALPILYSFSEDLLR